MKNKLTKDEISIPIPSWIIAIFIMVFTLSLCSCRTPQQKLDRLTRKHPELLQKDTIRVVDTFQVMVPGIRADTNMSKATFLERIRDTIIITNEHLRVQIHEHNDTIYLNAEVDTVYKTVIHKVEVPVDRVVQKNKMSWLEKLDIAVWACWIIVFGAVIARLYLYIRG